jgi:hypothetical protein
MKDYLVTFGTGNTITIDDEEFGEAVTLPVTAETLQSAIDEAQKICTKLTNWRGDEFNQFAYATSEDQEEWAKGDL